MKHNEGTRNPYISNEGESQFLLEQENTDGNFHCFTFDGLARKFPFLFMYQLLYSFNYSRDLDAGMDFFFLFFGGVGGGHPPWLVIFFPHFICRFS